MGKLPIDIAALKRRPTCFYVRLCVPEDLSSVVDHPKQLTMDIMKFGIAFDLNWRDCTYLNDNGYMAFSFECDVRADASIVERIMRAKFGQATVYNSLEYVKVEGVARLLGYAYDSKSYEGYVAAGRALFVHMVETVKILFPEKYLGMYGEEYSVAAGSRKVRQVITSDKAIEYGFRTPTISWTALSKDNLEATPVEEPDNYSWENIVYWLQEGVDPPIRKGDRKAYAAAVHLKQFMTVYWNTRELDMIETRMFYDMIADVHVAYDTYYKAQRFVQACDRSLEDNLASLENCTADDASANGYKARKLESYMMKVVIGQQFLQAVEDARAITELRALGKIEVQEDAIVQAYQTVVSEMTPSEHTKFCKMFDIKVLTGYMAAKRILGGCFGIDVSRRDKKAGRKHYSTLILQQKTLLDMHTRFGADLRRSGIQSKPMFRNLP